MPTDRPTCALFRIPNASSFRASSQLFDVDRTMGSKTSAVLLRAMVGEAVLVSVSNVPGLLLVGGLLAERLTIIVFAVSFAAPVAGRRLRPALRRRLRPHQRRAAAGCESSLMHEGEGKLDPAMARAIRGIYYR